MQRWFISRQPNITTETQQKDKHANRKLKQTYRRPASFIIGQLKHSFKSALTSFYPTYQNKKPFFPSLFHLTVTEAFEWVLHSGPLKEKCSAITTHLWSAGVQNGTNLHFILPPPPPPPPSPPPPPPPLFEITVIHCLQLWSKCCVWVQQ